MSRQKLDPSFFVDPDGIRMMNLTTDHNVCLDDIVILVAAKILDREGRILTDELKHLSLSRENILGMVASSYSTNGVFCIIKASEWVFGGIRSRDTGGDLAVNKAYEIVLRQFAEFKPDAPGHRSRWRNRRSRSKATMKT